MSLQSRLASLITAIGADIKSLNTSVAALQASNAWTTEILTAASTSSAVATVVEPFVGFTPAANTRYLVELELSVKSANATNGVQTALAGPSSGITNAAVKITSAASASADLVSHTALNTYQAATNSLLTASLIDITAIIEVGASPGAGKIRLQFHSEASILVTVNPGSIMRWRTV